MNHKTVVSVLALLASAQWVAAQGTAFAYQGRLSDSGQPATGVYDLQFTLWDAPTGPAQIGGVIAAENIGVVNGLFIVPLDFGPAIFDGSSRWLQIAVRPGASSGAFTDLAPRTPILPTPYAVFSSSASRAAVAGSASTAVSVPWSGITGMPAGFADGVDNDTQYTAGTGLSLVGTTFSLNAAYTDGRFVLKAGDTMTGKLTVPTLDVTGTTTTDRLSSRSGRILSLDGDNDIELMIDKAQTGITSFFEIFNGAGSNLFRVNESGNSYTLGNHTVGGTVSAAAFSGSGLGLTSAGLAGVTVLSVNCVALPAFTTSYTKLADLGAFAKQVAGSTVEITFNGRIYVETFTGGASGARFELRVDGAATMNGRARALIKAAEAGGAGVPVAITGIFTGLAAGNHTVSMWVQGVYAGGTTAMLDPGCWNTDHVVIKELK